MKSGSTQKKNRYVFGPKRNVLQLHYCLWLFTSAAWWKTPVIRFISGPMWSRKKVKKGLKYYDVKQLYFQSEFENLASLSPQKSTIVYTFSKSWLILDPNKTQQSLRAFPFCFPPKDKKFCWKLYRFFAYRSRCNYYCPLIFFFERFTQFIEAEYFDENSLN